jgi:hypothetical protein
MVEFYRKACGKRVGFSPVFKKKYPGFPHSFFVKIWKKTSYFA